MKNYKDRHVAARKGSGIANTSEVKGPMHGPSKPETKNRGSICMVKNHSHGYDGSTKGGGSSHTKKGSGY